MKLETVSGIKSLLSWERTSNNSGLFLKTEEVNPIIRKCAFQAFDEALRLSTKGPINVIKVWYKACDHAEAQLGKEIKTLCKTLGTIPEHIEKIQNKFRGNLGEIFIENFIKNGYLKGYDVNAEKYIPIDPEHENKLDGTSVSILNENIPMGIQIKNYSKNQAISTEVLIDALAMWAELNPIDSDPETIMAFNKKPRSFVVSFTDLKDNRFFESPKHSSQVAFIGPDIIKRELKTNTACEIFFIQICNEINSIK